MRIAYVLSAYKLPLLWAAVIAPFSTLSRKLPGSLRPLGGSSYWCLTGRCIEYIDSAATATAASLVARQ